MRVGSIQELWNFNIRGLLPISVTYTNSPYPSALRGEYPKEVRVGITTRVQGRVHRRVQAYVTRTPHGGHNGQPYPVNVVGSHDDYR